MGWDFYSISSCQCEVWLLKTISRSHVFMQNHLHKINIHFFLHLAHNRIIVKSDCFSSSYYTLCVYVIYALVHIYLFSKWPASHYKQHKNWYPLPVSECQWPENPNVSRPMENGQKLGKIYNIIKISWKFTKNFVKIIFIRENDVQIYVKLYFFLILSLTMLGHRNVIVNLIHLV